MPRTARPINEGAGWTGADHLVAGNYHSPDERLPVLAISRPCAGAKHDLSDFSQAGSRIACVHCLQGQQPVGHTYMLGRRNRPAAKSADHRDLGWKSVVIGDVKAQRDRACRSCTLDHVEPKKMIAALDQKMLCMSAAQDPRTHLHRIE